MVVEGEYEDIVAVLPKNRAVKDRDCKARRGERKAMDVVLTFEEILMTHLTLALAAVAVASARDIIAPGFFVLYCFGFDYIWFGYV